MEYRGWVEVGGIEIDNEDLWSPWLDVLIDRFGRFGPVLGWEENVASVVMSMDAESSGAAARIMFSAVADSGKYTNLRFSYSPESGYRLASFPGSKAVDVVPMNARLDLAGQREKNAEPQS